MFQKAISMTSKGTFTLPAKVRKHLGVTRAGDKLLLTFHEQSGVLELRQAPDFASLRQEIRGLKKSDQPLDVQAARLRHQQERAKNLL